MSDQNHVRRQNWILTELILTIIVLLLFDVFYDLRHNVAASHLYAELFCGFLGLTSIYVVWHRRIVPLESNLISTERKHRALEKELEDERQKFRESIASYVVNIRQEVDRQFTTWKLTAAEKTTALLLLKGLSLKDIATVRGVSEKTVKQHNLTIYQKSGLAGRAELSAFFLQDLLGYPDAEPDATAEETA